MRMLRRRLELIVVETHEKGLRHDGRQRKLVSPEYLSELPDFWTIESRLVDSLGIISRDLGRELSLNEFLTALAPDFDELDFFPLVPDAHQFDEDVKTSHRPVEVRFSRAHQQTAIQWKKSTIADEKEADEPDNAFYRGVRNELFRLAENRRIRFSVSLNHKLDFAEAEISGDGDKVSMVRTRILIVARPDSETARVVRALDQGLKVAKRSLSEIAFARVTRLRDLYILFLRSTGSFREELREIDRIWKDIVRDSEKILTRAGVEVSGIPMTLDDFDFDTVFDATSYWRDWNRVGR